MGLLPETQPKRIARKDIPMIKETPTTVHRGSGLVVNVNASMDESITMDYRQSDKQQRVPAPPSTLRGAD
jgi:hypothetical protein